MRGTAIPKFSAVLSVAVRGLRKDDKHRCDSQEDLLDFTYVRLHGMAVHQQRCFLGSPRSNVYHIQANNIRLTYTIPVTCGVSLALGN